MIIKYYIESKTPIKKLNSTFWDYNNNYGILYYNLYQRYNNIIQNTGLCHNFIGITFFEICLNKYKYEVSLALFP